MLVAGALSVEKAAEPSIPTTLLGWAIEGTIFGTVAGKVTVDGSFPNLIMSCSNTNVVAGG